MNFKDSYKLCNDEISGNRDVLASVLNGSAKKKSFDFRPVFACAALIVIVVSVAFFGFDKRHNNVGTSPERENNLVWDYNPPVPGNTDDYNKSESENVAGDNYTSADSLKIPDESGDGAGETKIIGDDRSDALQNSDTAVNTYEYETGENNTDIGKTDEEIGVSGEDIDDYGVMTADVLHESGEGIPVEPEDEYKIAVCEDYDFENPPDGDTVSPYVSSGGTSEYTAPAKSGGGGGSAASGGSRKTTASDATVSESISMDEYFRYLGIDVLSEARLPSDMSFKVSPAVSVQKKNGVIVGDEVSICAYSSEESGRYVIVTMSKINTRAKQYTGNSQSYVEAGDDGPGKAYIMSGDVSVCISSYGISADELKQLVNSLK